MSSPPIISEDIYDFSYLLDVKKSPSGGLLYRSSRRSPIADDKDEVAMFPQIFPSRLTKYPTVADERFRHAATVVHPAIFRESDMTAVQSETSAYREPVRERNHGRSNILPVIAAFEQKAAHTRSSSYVANGTNINEVSAKIRNPASVSWKQQKELRVENAMNRLKQNRINDFPLMTETNRSQLTPINHVKQRHEWEEEHHRASMRATDRVQQEYVDELRMINMPPGELLNENISTKTEIELDKKRQILLARKRELKELKKQHQCAIVAAEAARGTVPRDSHQRNASAFVHQTPVSTSNGSCAFAPHRPTAPSNGTNADSSYSKRKRKLRTQGQQQQAPVIENSIERKECHIESSKQELYPPTSDAMVQTQASPTPPSQQQYAARPPAYVLSCNSEFHTMNWAYSSPSPNLESPDMFATEERAGVSFDSDFHDTFHPSTAALANCNVASSQSRLASVHVPLVPRQSSQPMRSWNGETAKRGLGFKSKRRREAEEAKANDGGVNAREVKHNTISKDARQKWKKDTIYPN